MVAGCAAGASVGTPTSTARSTGAAPAIPSHQAATVQHVETVLAQTPKFPGATKLTVAPKSDLADAPDMSRPPTFIQRTGWWTSPMTSDQFHDWLLQHVPPFWSLPGGDSTGTVGAKGSLMQFEAGPRADAVWTYSAADVFWEPVGARIVIRVSAQADWVAEKASAESIPADVAAVDVRVMIRDPQFTTTATLPPTVHRKLTGADVAQLRALVNSLNPWTDTGLHLCLATSGMTDVLVFTGPKTKIQLTVHDGGCTGTDFVLDGKALAPLEDSVLHPALVRMLDLPDEYASMW